MTKKKIKWATKLPIKRTAMGKEESEKKVQILAYAQAQKRKKAA